VLGAPTFQLTTNRNEFIGYFSHFIINPWRYFGMNGTSNKTFFLKVTQLQSEHSFCNIWNLPSDLAKSQFAIFQFTKNYQFPAPSYFTDRIGQIAPIHYAFFVLHIGRIFFSDFHYLQNVSITHLNVYVNRFYKRQSITRKALNSDILAKTESILDDYQNQKTCILVFPQYNICLTNCIFRQVILVICCAPLLVKTQNNTSTKNSLKKQRKINKYKINDQRNHL